MQCETTEKFFIEITVALNDLLKKDTSVSMHHRNIQSLAVELFKVMKNLSNKIMSDNFSIRVFKL